MLETDCTRCKAPVIFPERLAEELVRCPTCGKKFLTPTAEECDVVEVRGKVENDQVEKASLLSRARKPRSAVPLIVGAIIACLVLGCVLVGIVVLPVFKRAIDAGMAAAQKERELEAAGVRLKTAQIDRATEPIIVRGDCSLTTYFNYDFSNVEKTHYSICLKQFEPWAEVHAYILRNSADGMRLYELLSDGRERRMTLQIKLGKEISVAELIRVVSAE